MNKMARTTTWVVFNGVFAASLWYGQVEQVSGAWNVAVFIIWFSFVGSLCSVPETVRRAMQDKGPSVPVIVDALFDIAVVAFLVWFGHWWLATTYVVHSVLLQAAYKTKPQTPSPDDTRSKA